MDTLLSLLMPVVFAAILLTVLLRLRALEKRISALKDVNMKLAFLLQHTPTPYAPFNGLPSEVVEALTNSANRVEAVANYRKATGSGLREADAIIGEAIEKTGIAL